MSDLEDEGLAEASRLAPPRVPTATIIRKQLVNVFRCPVCGNEFRHDNEYEPMCTGPNWTDDHPMTIMKFVRAEEPKKLIL